MNGAGFPFQQPPHHHGHGHGPWGGRGCGGKRRHQNFKPFEGQGVKLGDAQPGHPEEGNHHGHPGRHNIGPHWRRAMKHAFKMANCGEQNERIQWKEKRGLVKVSNETHTTHRSETFFASVTIRNDTPYPYKQGCSIQSNYNDSIMSSLKQVVFPINFPVEGNAEFTVNLPIEVFPEAPYQNGSADFLLMKENGTSFGQKISVKFRIAEKITEGEFF